MRRRNGDLGMDKGTYCLDIADGPASHTPRVDPQAPVQYVAATKTQGSVMFRHAYGVVQDAGVSSPVRAGIQ